MAALDYMHCPARMTRTTEDQRWMAADGGQGLLREGVGVDGRNLRKTMGKKFSRCGWSTNRMPAFKRRLWRRQAELHGLSKQIPLGSFRAAGFSYAEYFVQCSGTFEPRWGWVGRSR